MYASSGSRCLAAMCDCRGAGMYALSGSATFCAIAVVAGLPFGPACSTADVNDATGTELAVVGREDTTADM